MIHATVDHLVVAGHWAGGGLADPGGDRPRDQSAAAISRSEGAQLDIPQPLRARSVSELPARAYEPVFRNAIQRAVEDQGPRGGADDAASGTARRRARRLPQTTAARTARSARGLVQSLGRTRPGR